MARLEHDRSSARLAGAAALTVLLTAAGGAAAGEAPATPVAGARAEMTAIHPDDTGLTREHLACFLGIGRATIGNSPLSTTLVVIPPGGEAEARTGGRADTAIYVLEGGVETRFGPGLGKSVVNRAGEFLYVPAGLPHQPVNLSARLPARAIIARSGAGPRDQVVSDDRSATR